jgi:hypothetical protein
MMIGSSRAGRFSQERSAIQSTAALYVLLEGADKSTVNESFAGILRIAQFVECATCQDGGTIIVMAWNHARATFERLDHQG